jgi:hypothetical protein
LLSNIETMLYDMEDKGKIDLAILPKFDELIGLAKNQERMLDSEGNGDRMTTFSRFHSWRNCRLVLSKMKDCFSKAQSEGNNPDVALDALEVLPTLVSSFSILATREADPNSLLEQSQLLRETAAKVGMLPELSEEMAEVDRKELTRKLSQFTEALRPELEK